MPDLAVPATSAEHINRRQVPSRSDKPYPPPSLPTSNEAIIDFQPYLSVTGSLATILWLSALRREGQEVGFGQFLKLGALVMPAALLPAIGALIRLG